MEDFGSAFPRRLVVFFFTALIATSLILTAVILASANPSYSGNSFAGMPENFQPIADNVDEALHAVGLVFVPIVHAATSTSNFIASATNVPALIRPADYKEVPVITATAIRNESTDIPTSVPAPSIPQPPTSATTGSVPAASASAYVANGYAWGNCTWWVASRRAQIGDPIPGSWGNAAHWAVQAAHDGYTVDHTPSPGAIMQTAYSAHGLGHVAFVESVDPDGTWHISEMNVIGLNKVDRQAEPPPAAASYNFIHDKR